MPLPSGFGGGILGGASVSIVINAVDHFSATMNKATGQANTLKGSLLALGGVAKVAGLAAATGMAALTVSSVKAAADLDVVSRGFNRLSDDSTSLLSSLDAATSGIVSDMDLMQSANRALVGGLNEADLARTFHDAAVVGQAMGKDVTSSINDITEALIKSQPEILDNLGINVKLSETNKALADRLGITVDKLTQQQSQAEFARVAMEKLRQKSNQLGGDIEVGLNENLKKMNKNFEQVKVSIGTEMLPALTELSESLANNKELLADFGSTVVTTFQVIGGAVKFGLNQLDQFGNALATLSQAAEDIHNLDFEAAGKHLQQGEAINTNLEQGLSSKLAVKYGGIGITDTEEIKRLEAREAEMKKGNVTLKVGTEIIQDNTDARLNSDALIVDSNLSVAESAAAVAPAMKYASMSLRSFYDEWTSQGSLKSTSSGKSYALTGAAALAQHNVNLSEAQHRADVGMGTIRASTGNYEELGGGGYVGKGGVQTNVGYDISSGTFKNINEFSNKAAGVNNTYNYYYQLATSRDVENKLASAVASQGGAG